MRIPAHCLLTLAPRHHIPIFLRIRLPCPLQQTLDFCLQPPLFFPHPPIPYSLALTRPRSYLRPVYRQLPETRQPYFPRHTNHLHQHPLEVLQMPTTKLAQHPMNRKVPRTQHPKRHVLLQLARYPARRKYPRRIPVHQHLQHRPGLIRCVPAPVPFIPRVKCRRHPQCPLLSCPLYPTHYLLRCKPPAASNRCNWGVLPTSSDGTG